jgi:hypothetical protein
MRILVCRFMGCRRIEVNEKIGNGDAVAWHYCRRCGRSSRNGPAIFLAKNANLEYRTSDHPEANGRISQSGDRAWDITVPLDDGRVLTLRFGRQALRELQNAVLDELVND